MKSKRYLVYWHKMANSGIWGYDTLTMAESIALDLAKHEQMFDVHIIDAKDQMILSYKGDRNKTMKGD